MHDIGRVVVVWMMSAMTDQPPLPMAPESPCVDIGPAAALVEDADGGRVFLHGQVCFAWDAGDVTLRRLAAVQLVRIRAARVMDVAAAFGVDTATLRRWGYRLVDAGAAGLVPARLGPKGPSRLLPDVVAEIRSRRAAGASLRAIAAATGVSTGSVRNALTDTDTDTDTDDGGSSDVVGGAALLPVLPDPVDRSGERAAARWGLIEAAPPVFAPAARVPLAGLLLGLPGVQASGLLSCARAVFGGLPAGFYGLDTMLVEGVLRALAGQPRAEGATRIDPVAFGRILGLDRAPEVKTIRRKLGHLAATGKVEALVAAMAAHHAQSRPDAAAVLYVDGHVRAYSGTRKIAKTHLARLRFPAPATVETWVSDADGDPVFVVMADPGASLAGELRRLLPQLRTIVGDDRRVLVGFDRGGWSPTLFADMIAAGFDILTWRKAPADNVDPALFTDVAHVDAHGRSHTWTLADTTITWPIADGPRAGQTLRLRQVTRTRADGHQAHILTSRTDLTPGEVVFRMGSRWRQENYFRYARIHFDLDSHDSYTTTGDDPERMVPNPAKKPAHAAVVAARARADRAKARADANLLALHTPAPGQTEVMVTNIDHDAATADWFAAEDELAELHDAHRAIPTRLPLGQVHPGQQVLDTQTKLLTHAIRMAAFNTITALARAVVTDTGYSRARDEAHTFIRHALLSSGDLDPGPRTLTVRLDPMPTPRATAALAELCDQLTATGTYYPGTNLQLRYQVKPHR